MVTARLPRRQRAGGHAPRRALGVAVVASAVFCSAADAPLTTAGVLVTNPEQPVARGHDRNPTVLWLALDGSPTEAQLKEAAAHDRVVVLNSWETHALHEIKRLNPHVTVLVYKSISATRSDPAGPLEASGVRYADARPEWFARSAVTGQRLEWREFPPNYQMTVWLPAYQDAWAAAVQQEVMQAGWDGVFADDAVSRVDAHVSVPMVGCSSDLEMRAAVAALVTKAGRALVARGKVLVPNVADASTYDGWWSRLAKFGGGFEEYLAHVGPDPLSGFVTSERDGAWLRQAALLGETALPLAHTDAADDDDTSFAYGLATFWVAGGGRGAFSVTPPGVHGAVHRRVEQGWDLGDPTGPAKAVGGAYVRAFSSGFVAVNPTLSTVRVAVPPGMVDADGAYSSSVELRPHRSLISRRA